MRTAHNILRHSHHWLWAWLRVAEVRGRPTMNVYAASVQRQNHSLPIVCWDYFFSTKIHTSLLSASVVSEIRLKMTTTITTRVLLILAWARAHDAAHQTQSECVLVLDYIWINYCLLLFACTRGAALCFCWWRKTQSPVLLYKFTWHRPQTLLNHVPENGMAGENNEWIALHQNGYRC